MSIATWMGSQGGAGGGAGPVNLTIPSIIGTPVDGTDLIMNVGTWSGTVTGFEAEIRATDLSATYFARQTVTESSSFTIPGTAVGKSIELRVWATGPAGTTLATSAAFGPITAAGDTFIIALAFNTAAQTITSSFPFTQVTGATFGAAPVTHNNGAVNLGTTALYSDTANVNQNIGGGALRFGMAGASASTSAIASTAFSSSKAKGRWSTNAAASASYMRIDIPDSGTDDVYKIYMGLGRSESDVAVNFGVWSGAPETNYLGGITPAVQDVTDIVDATGTRVAIGTWDAASPIGMGSPIEVTVPAGTGRFISIGRATGLSTPHINAIAVFKKV